MRSEGFYVNEKSSDTSWDDYDIIILYYNKNYNIIIITTVLQLPSVFSTVTYPVRKTQGSFVLYIISIMF